MNDYDLVTEYRVKTNYRLSRDFIQAEINRVRKENRAKGRNVNEAVNTIDFTIEHSEMHEKPRYDNQYLEYRVKTDKR